MDKNKSRTDLLAAGRKKLQKYRQKKDNKGGSSHGKSSKKAGKSGQPGSDAASSTAESEGLRQVLEEEIASHTDPSLRNTGSSVSNSLDNFDLVGLQSTVVTPVWGTDDALISDDAGTSMHDAGVHESITNSSNVNEGKSAQIIDDEMKRAQSPDTSVVKDPDREVNHSDMPVNIDSNNGMTSDSSWETVDSPMSHSLEDSVTVDTSTQGTPQIETPKNPLSYNAEITEISSDLSSLNKGESAEIIGDETARVQSMEMSSIKDSDKEMEQQNVPINVDGTRVMTFPAVMGHISVDEKKSLTSQEDARDMPLIPARADQGQCRMLVIWFPNNLAKAVT